jgi:hypothetical protein
MNAPNFAHGAGKERDTRPRIFISYRRADAAAMVGHLYERLIGRYGKDCIFRDVDNIPLASDFRNNISTDLSRSDVVLVIIGPRWLGATGNGARIHNYDDPVRSEVETALRTGACVLPVLVEGASMPSPAEVPESLHALCYFNAARVEPGKDFDPHARELFSCVDGLLHARGKFVTRFPAWARRVALCCALVSCVPVAALTLTIAGVGPKTSPLAITLSIVAASLALAGACALVFGDVAARRRVPLAVAQRHAGAVSAAIGVLSFALLFLSTAFLQPWLPTHAIANPLELARRLRVEFIRVRDNTAEDFKQAETLVQALKALDPQNGHAWYFAGEIKRVQNQRLFTSKSCFKGWTDTAGSLDAYQQDFYAYREVALTLPASEIGSDPSGEVCYARANGYCVQRLAWIYHLLANDFFLHASGLHGARRYTALHQAQEFAYEARKYRRPEGGEGFNQCQDSASLVHSIADALDASKGEALSRTSNVFR